MDKIEQTDLSYARGFFQARLGDGDTDGDARARGIIRAMADEIETLRAEVASLEKRAKAPRIDEAGAERARCEDIVRRWTERIKGWNVVDRIEADGAGFVCTHILDEIKTDRPRNSNEARQGLTEQSERAQDPSTTA